MSADDLLARLEKVRPCGRGSWMACCPAHEDREPSLSVRECPDGTLLIKCFAGCSAVDIIEAVGLELVDLFPLKPASPDYTQPHKPRGKPPIIARDLIRTMRHQLLVVAIAANQLARGEPLAEPDQQTVDAACRYFYELLGEVEHVA